MSAKQTAVEVRVTKGILWIGSEAYPLRNITRMSTTALAPDRRATIRSYGISVALLLTVAPIVASVAPTTVGSVVAVVALAGIGIRTYWLARRLNARLHGLVIETSTAAHRALISNDPHVVSDLLHKIAEAVEDPTAEFRFWVENYHVDNSISMFGDNRSGIVKIGVGSHRGHGVSSSGSEPTKEERSNPQEPIIRIPRMVDQSPETALGMATFPVTIYLADESAAAGVEAAVEVLLHTAGFEVLERDEPIIGSWFRRMRAGRLSAQGSPIAREAAAVAAHALESRAVHGQDATVTATMMQNLPALLTSLQPTKNAVIRVGALLIVKVEEVVTVHQLTSAQQLHLDHQPRLLTSPQDILQVLELSDGSEGTVAFPGSMPWLLSDTAGPDEH